MRPIGFSTGAVARGNFRFALQRLRENHLQVVELSALRFAELEPLLTALPALDLASFKFVSIHAPSLFKRDDESTVVRNLIEHAQGLPVVVHPDVIFNTSIWAPLGRRLLIENMDKRKPIGRTVAELRQLFHSPSRSKVLPRYRSRAASGSKHDRSCSHASRIRRSLGRSSCQRSEHIEQA